MLFVFQMTRSPREERKHELLISVGAFAVVVIFVLLIFAAATNDHEYGCETEADRAHSLPYFRPIESKDFGTPARSPYGRIGPYNDEWRTHPFIKGITNLLCDQDTVFEGVVPAKRVSNLFWVFGQFISHSFALQNSLNGEPAVFGQTGVFAGVRPSEFVLDKQGRQQQVNLMAPYLDGSVVYGHVHSITESLRAPHGKLRVSNSPHHEGPLLPVNSTTDRFFAGDVRVNENVLLTAMHTLWHREHNHWAEKLKEENPHWTSQHVFDTARLIVIGEIQAITYREWLPLLLNSRDLDGREPCRRSSLEAVTFNEFATAAFRLGHTLVTETLEARDIITGNLDISKSLTLVQAFEQVSVGGSLWLHDIDFYLYGASLQQANNLDSKVIDELRGGMFDLVGFNLARGRNHKLASYQQLYELVTGREFSSYSQISRSRDLQEAFYDAYGDPCCTQIDPWVAIVAEDKYAGSMLGRVGSHIVAEQFDLFRNADPYFYLWDEASVPYRAQIHNTRLSDVIRRNTRISWEDLGPNVFVL